MKVGENPVSPPAAALPAQAPVQSAAPVSTKSQLTSASPAKSFSDYFWGFVGWVKELFTRFFDCILFRKKPPVVPVPTQQNSGKPGVPPLPSRAERKQAEADATNAALAARNANNNAAPPVVNAAPVVLPKDMPDQAVETLTKWLTPHLPKFKEVWEKASFEQKKTFFHDVLKRGYPITSKEEAIAALTWARANVDKFAPADNEKNLISEIHISLQNLIGLCGGDKTKYSVFQYELPNMLDELIAIQKRRDALYRQIDTEKLTEPFKNWKYEGFSVGSVVANALPPKIEFVDGENGKQVTYEFTPEAYALCSAHALSRSAAEGKFYSTCDMMKTVADRRWEKDKKPVDLMASAVLVGNDNYKVIADKQLLNQLRDIARFQFTVFLSSKTAQFIKFHDKDAPLPLYLVAYTEQKVDNKIFPMESNKEGFLFAPLYKNS